MPPIGHSYHVLHGPFKKKKKRSGRPGLCDYLHLNEKHDSYLFGRNFYLHCTSWIKTPGSKPWFTEVRLNFWVWLTGGLIYLRSKVIYGTSVAIQLQQQLYRTNNWFACAAKMAELSHSPTLFNTPLGKSRYSFTNSWVWPSLPAILSFGKLQTGQSHIPLWNRQLRKQISVTDWTVSLM